ncbi:MAG: hypothetical protein ACRCXX_04630, partial [Cetobacterium sp.]|uniref:hypothetical protein n=1 Tax=Cetobacterium sp. TaxID=2071632 RepID=UPI003F325BB3
MKKIYTSNTTFDAYTRYPDNYYEIEEYLERNNMEQKYILFNGDLYDRDKDFKVAKLLRYDQFIFCRKLFLSSDNGLSEESKIYDFNDNVRWNDLALVPKLPKQCDSSDVKIRGGIQEIINNEFVVDDNIYIIPNKDFETSGKVSIQIKEE